MDSVLSSGGSNASGDSIGGISSGGGGGGGRGCNSGKNNNRLQRIGDTSTTTHGSNSEVNAEVKKIYQ